jgi:hypothetical protein
MAYVRIRAFLLADVSTLAAIFSGYLNLMREFVIFIASEIAIE